jgi:hypothetical protein
VGQRLSGVHVATHPAFFRAPMMTSQIHAVWDAKFCESTTYQLEQTGLQWSDVCLTNTEQQVVQHHEMHGEWLTMQQLELKNTQQTK